ncbi:MAG: acyl carrier protein [Clostridiales bacterium]|nr:acyl carrier protein [Clostridiales bacterium]
MELRERVFELLAELTSMEEISEYDELAGDLGLDSLGMITLLVAIEDTFQIELEESDMDPLALQTVDDIVQLLEKYLEERE